jgi:hypothetical protein
LSRVVAVAVAANGNGAHTVALKSHGTVWARGDNGNGRLGDSTQIERHLPVRVAALSLLPVCGSAMAACSAGTGTCVAPPGANGIPCDDGSACTQTDTCQAGICTATTPVICSAFDDCHDAGVCDPASGVCSNPEKADGTPCSLGECQSGTCRPFADAGADGQGKSTTVGGLILSP